MDDFPIVEVLIQASIIRNDVDFVNGAMTGERARRRVGKEAWREIRRLSGNELTMLSIKTCINSMENCLTNLTCLIFLVQRTKNSWTTWSLLTLNQSVSKMKSFEGEKMKTMDWETYSNFRINNVQFDSRILFPLRFYSSWLVIIFHYCFGDFGYTK